MTLSDYGQKTNAYITDYIKFGDAKAGAVLTLAGLIAGGVGSTVPKTLGAASRLESPAILVALVSVAATVVLAMAVYVAWQCASALNPNTADGKSLNSFPDIAKLGQQEYVEKVSALSDASIAAEYAKHNWLLSKIAGNTFANIRAAVTWLRWLIISGAAYGIIAVLVISAVGGDTAAPK